MRTKSFAFLAALCCTVLSGVADVSQSVEVGESAELARAGGRNIDRARNLGLATDLNMLLDGTTAVFTVSEAGQKRDLNGDGDMGDQVAHVFDARTDEVRNLGLDTNINMLLKGRVLALCAEERRSVDFNGDGDQDDAVLHVYDTVKRTLTNLRLAGCGSGFASDGARLVFGVAENRQGGQDLNQDGDSNDDDILHLYDLVTGRIQNIRLKTFIGESSVILDGRWIIVAADENGNGIGTVVHVFDTATGLDKRIGVQISFFEPTGFTQGFKVDGGQALAAALEDVDLNGDGDLTDKVLQRIDLRSGRVENTGIAIASSPFSAGLFGPADPAVFIAQEGLAVFSIAEADQGKDLNGDGDISDLVLHKMSTRTGRLQNLKVSGRVLLSESAPGRGVVFMSELENGKDLNGDGDLGPSGGLEQFEVVLGLVDLRGSEPRVVNTRLAISLTATNFDDIGAFAVDTDAFQIRDDLVSFVVPEELQGNRDLNGDGDTADAVLHIADLSTFTTRNTGLSGAFAFRPVQAPMLPASDGRAVVSVRESRQGRDLNRDGDVEDMVLQTIDVRSGRSRNTGLAIATSIPAPFTIFGLPLMIRGESFVSVLVPEGRVDLNSDGDRADNVLHILDIASGKLTNVGLASATSGLGADTLDPSFRFAGMCPGFSFLGRFDGPACVGPGLGDAYTFLVSEAAQGNVDLNGDGDTDDTVVHATRLTDRDRNGRFDFSEESARRAGEYLQ